MKVKTPELSGMALCYAVCMIEMPNLVWGKTIGTHHASNQIVVPELPEPKCYSPLTGWDMFGPIIEREKIFIIAPYRSATSWEAYKMEWDQPELPSYTEDGPTPLIAAMRCLIASRLGDEVEIPEELCK